MLRRQLFDELKKHTAKPEITILTGARQVGKTTLVKQLGDELMAGNGQVYYLTLEDPEILANLNEHPDNIFNYIPLSENPGGKIFTILDEIQYLDDPSNFLKLLYDKYSHYLKLITTGSSAFYMDQKFKDSLAGRKRIFKLNPLSFEEFLEFKNLPGLQKELALIRQNQKYISGHFRLIQQQFEEFLTFGGYPAIVTTPERNDKIEKLKELRDSFVKKDMLEFGVNDEMILFSLCKILAPQIGNLFNRHEVAKQLRKDDHTIDRYMILLQKAFHIHLIRPYHRNFQKELRKMPKVYFNDTGLRNAFLQNFQSLDERTDKGALLENYVFERLRELFGQDALRFWRTTNEKELDFLVLNDDQEGLAYEVKWDDKQYKPRKYQQFLGHYPGFALHNLSYHFTEAGNWVVKL